MSDEQITFIQAEPPNFHDMELRKAFASSIVQQSSLMDSVAQQVLMIELAIPGLYATALQLTQGEDATVAVSRWLIGAFICWIIAIGLTLRALFPRDWNVDPDKIDSDPDGKSKKIGIKNFYRDSAVYKRRYLVASVIAFLLGIMAATLPLVP